MAYTVIHSQDYSADTTALWENSVTVYSTPIDPDFPFVTLSRNVDLVPGDGPSGENIVSMTPLSSVQEFHGYGPWDSTCGRVVLDMRVASANATTMDADGFDRQAFVLKSSIDVNNAGNIGVYITSPSITGSTLTFTWVIAYNYLAHSSSIAGAGSIDIDTWQRFVLSWHCGSNPVAGGSLLIRPTADSDGWIKLTQRPSSGGAETTVHQVTGIPLYTGTGWGALGGGTFTDLNENDYFSSSFLDFTNISIEQCALATTALVAGVKTTVTAPRAIAFGLDNNTNVHSTAGMFKVFGDMESTGTMNVAGTDIDADVSDGLDLLGT